ncbi:MAG: Electron transfer flavoprotein alpha/beta-subunit, partial [Aeromicrobium sp.]|nr:Electron transfer flavoprotein alpha/beta-subunit [Aeromicrobium sp.]
GDDLRFSGVSHADQAALEIALRLGEALGLEVLTISAGPVGCERALRDASACGAQHVLRLDMPSVSESRDVAAALAEAAGAAAVIVCGDHSIDRGSGSVPAFIAHHRQAAQALGLVSLDLPASTAGALRAVRRLDGGRREVLSVPLPCVVSVESSVASLRRASLRRALAAESATVPSRSITVAHRAEAGGSIASFRPRPRALSAPSGAALDRVRQLTDADTAPAHGETIDLEPRAAAERVLAALRDWGYLSPDPARPTRPRDER